MIKISHLNKIYKSKKRRKCHALNDINLTLPDTGLVFVLGKSGSGKSTLLNLIGGLDSISSGSISVDGNDLADFKERDFCNYRNTHIGFIFQDYHLIDELTVYENIVLSLNLRQIEDRDKVKAALAKVDLAGYEDRYPTELSGGEQQRVAIARAIVKNPRIILADEPTGNLDTGTATAVIELLKVLSKECLILIVSHNINDANNYADRIIELRGGKIISDRSRNPAFLDQMSLENGELIYPQGLALSDTDIDFINGNLTKFVKKTDKFLPTVEPKQEEKRVKIENKGLAMGKKIGLSGKFLKNKTLAISFSAFMVAVIMVIMALAQTIIAFDGSKIIDEEMRKSNLDSILLNKVLDEDARSRLNVSYHSIIGKDDVQAFYDAGYQGKIYKGVNYTIPISSSSNMRGRKENIFTGSIYISQTLSTLIVDEEFMENKFGEVEYCAQRTDFHPQGVIITDYIADAILLTRPGYSNKTYADLIKCGYIYQNGNKQGWIKGVFLINGIIETGYKNTYKDLIDKISDTKKELTINDLYEDPDFQIFLNDVYDRLGYSYTLNPNFTEQYLSAESWAYPTYYKMVFNGISELSHNYVDMRRLSDNGTKLMGSWAYTETPPIIPDGAKYIRLSYYYPQIQNYTKTHYGKEQDYPILAFDHGEPIGREQLFYHANSLLSVNGNLSQNNSSYVVSDYIEIPENAEITQFLNIMYKNNVFYSFYDAEKNFISSEITSDVIVEDESVLLLPVSTYENLFPEAVEKLGENWTEKVVPQKMKLSHFAYWDVDNKNPLFEKEVTVDVHNGSVIYVSDDLFSLFYKDSIFEYTLYFDGTNGVGAVIDFADEMNYEHQSYAIEGIRTMTKAVDVFIPIFELIAVFLCVGVIFILMSFSTKMVKDKMHEIGILKALGTKNTSIGVIFGSQVILIAILTCLLSTAGYYFFIDLANDVLVESLKRLAPSNIVLDLDFLTFRSEIAALNCLLIFSLALISLIFPLLKIKAIKPVKIIKAKE